MALPTTQVPGPPQIQYTDQSLADVSRETPIGPNAATPADQQAIPQSQALADYIRGDRTEGFGHRLGRFFRKVSLGEGDTIAERAASGARLPLEAYIQEQGQQREQEQAGTQARDVAQGGAARLQGQQLPEDSSLGFQTGYYGAEPSVYGAQQKVLQSYLGREPEPGPDLKTIEGIERQTRKEIGAVTGYTQKVQNAYADMTAGYVDADGYLKENITGAADLAAVFKFMKALDPESVVRESEYAAAAGLGSLFDRMQNAYEKAKQGSFLQPVQREAFLGLANEYLKNAKSMEAGVHDWIDNTFVPSYEDRFGIDLDPGVIKGFGMVGADTEYRGRRPGGDYGSGTRTPTSQNISVITEALNSGDPAERALAEQAAKGFGMTPLQILELSSGR